jgi:hypothetical protein
LNLLIRKRRRSTGFLWDLLLSLLGIFLQLGLGFGHLRLELQGLGFGNLRLELQWLRLGLGLGFWHLRLELRGLGHLRLGLK